LLMPEAVIQPSIPVPDFDFADGRTYSQWIREVGPQLNLDVSKLCLGGVLSKISGDDSNAFGHSLGSPLIPALADYCKKAILERMDWEISMPETPVEIKTRLEEEMKLIKPLDFNQESNFQRAKETWVVIRDWVREQIKLRQDWQEAIDYREKTNDTWAPHWNQFWNSKNSQS